ncbi:MULTISPECIES: SIMPL domain-containing protein [Arcobacteraceae]|uniref:SIMPL domain-containing protein n=3 Tax=Arcobacteraceae TaxID=2808963 RepID=A0AAP4PM05_9BACT|nr:MULTISPECIES: SIMPL domain-containing protein [Arcobacteraceae]MCP3649953.1 SIMPL domain-containing protein [Arcobacter sp. DNRA7]MBF7065972.1 SIMPL domain-containing protein [Aliarcobacter butzleri]MCG3656297.1 SIMPL domain-containing protein [Aliarcobacter butzleri]MCG3659415.1 SIMPL domain-containing protein [Aliarcobacter butzleri]MCG3662775.1 SIMPL domain-containing protein [Aliarcobacter butzleri]
MEKLSLKSSFVLGFFIFIGLGTLGYFISSSFLKSKELERTVIVKGLSEKEVQANIVLWPIKFSATASTLDELSKKVESDTNKVLEFLNKYGVKKEDITVNSPSIIDKNANEFTERDYTLRYLANRTINIYSQDIEKIRDVSGKLFELSQNGILFRVDDWDSKIEYLYTKLNEIKPAMIEEATANAREVAQKFAQDSNSKLGKIKKATQGQFEITSRDKNSEHIKNIRIVSTVEYYLND